MNCSKKSTLSDKNSVHLVGIGGIGMSGIAQILLARGVKVSGSDLKQTALTKKLQDLGGKIFIGHDFRHLQDADILIYSSAVKSDNPELIRARAKGIPLITRAEGLAQLANQKKSIAVTGAHGKTTTASLIAHTLLSCGLKPTVCVGGELFNIDGNVFLGDSDYFVLEADESDGSFLNFTPFYSVVTNIDREHLDYYRDLDHIVESFTRFMQNTKPGGTVFYSADDPLLVKLQSCLKSRTLSYGLKPEAEIFAQDIELHSRYSRFRCVYRKQDLGQLDLSIPGQHNIINALAALAIGLEVGLDFRALSQALSLYSGVRRRLELKLKRNDILVFEDYAHHPTEIKATLASLQSFKPKRLFAVFQPHRYTRTKFLIDDFGRCFSGADRLIVTDIYAASEPPIEGVTARNICQKAQEAKVKEVLFLPRKDILAHLLAEVQSGDLVAILGAGDIGSVTDALVRELKIRSIR
ncbi:UDP-N-acetylmuramate--L-alanine ligase [Candidatus Omnitrophota bacterium]